jgi:CheY-like chemotaxis protein
METDMPHIYIYQGNDGLPLPKFIFAVLRERNFEDDSLQAVLQKTSALVLLMNNFLDLLEAASDILPDLIVLDYDLQETNGITAAEQLRQRKFLNKIPVLVLNVPPGQRKKHNQRKNEVYLEHPISFDEIFSSIGRLLEPPIIFH